MTARIALALLLCGLLAGCSTSVSFSNVTREDVIEECYRGLAARYGSSGVKPKHRGTRIDADEGFLDIHRTTVWIEEGKEGTVTVSVRAEKGFLLRFRRRDFEKTFLQVLSWMLLRGGRAEIAGRPGPWTPVSDVPQIESKGDTVSTRIYGVSLRELAPFLERSGFEQKEKSVYRSHGTVTRPSLVTFGPDYHFERTAREENSVVVLSSSVHRLFLGRSFDRNHSEWDLMNLVLKVLKEFPRARVVPQPLDSMHAQRDATGRSDPRGPSGPVRRPEECWAHVSDAKTSLRASPCTEYLQRSPRGRCLLARRLATAHLLW